jgi:hypothetical protein
VGHQLFYILAFLVFFHNYVLYSFISKMDSNLDAIIIGAEVTHSGPDIIGASFSYMAIDVASSGGRRHTPWTASDLAVQEGRRQDLWRLPLELATSSAT